MYRKEIIYLGLYKDGSRIGNAGFLKVEDRTAESRLDLKLRNIPHNISGRFPIRIHNGADWKEINGISVQEGGGNWADKMMDSAERLQIQIMLPGGYFLEGKSKDVQQSPQKDGLQKAQRDQQQNMGQVMRQRPQENIQEVPQETMKQHQRQKAQEVPQATVWQSPHQNSQEILPQTMQQSPHQNSQEAPQQIEQQNPHQNSQEAPQQIVQQNPQQGTRGEIQQIIRQESPKNILEEPKNLYTDWPIDAENGQKTRNLSKNETKTILITEELPRPAAERNLDDRESLQGTATAYSLKEDKWEQILDSYEKIHPYGDERVYVKLEPKDFIILQSKYQHLVNNSFLLHGFYNYRYLILGKEQDYYLGVPGVFYEREKMVALMFGFEAFECSGGVARAGEFGYYLRKVEL